MEPRPHQIEGVAWLQRVQRGLLADSPRSGKTAQLLTAATGRTLVIAPPFLRSTWAEQKELWAPDLDLTFVGYNSLAKRVPNKEGKLLKNEPYPKDEFRGRWDTVICDESHNLANPNANWTQTTGRLLMDRLYLATGTPITHWVHNLLPTLRLLYPGDKRFTNKRRWLDQWFKMTQNPHSLSMEPYIPPGDPNQGLLDEFTWSDFWLENGLDGFDGRMLQREIDLGVPTTTQTIDVPMTGKQHDLYKQLRRDYIGWLPSGEEVSAWSSGGLHVKLMKCGTGLESLDPRGHRGPSTGKYGVVRELLPEARRSPTLLFCWFQSTAHALERLALKLNLRVGRIDGGVAIPNRDPIREKFQNGDLDVVVATIPTISEGLEFSAAGTEIFVEHAATPWRNDQALKRAMVLGKKSHVHIIHLWTPKSVDVGLQRIVQGKTEQQVKALSAREFRSVIDG